ncbi:hypothetical protein [Amycolatopsis sp. NPDC059657]|uniref:hypothetical protein n=1 Tax=Amycolatopsis sp. NPDC059657 TaxID=3346899 RepID=UPI003671E621
MYSLLSTVYRGSIDAFADDLFHTVLPWFAREAWTMAMTWALCMLVVVIGIYAALVPFHTVRGLIRLRRRIFQRVVDAARRRRGIKQDPDATPTVGLDDLPDDTDESTKPAGLGQER